MVEERQRKRHGEADKDRERERHTRPEVSHFQGLTIPVEERGRWLLLGDSIKRHADGGPQGPKNINGLIQSSLRGWNDRDIHEKKPIRDERKKRTMPPSWSRLGSSHRVSAQVSKHHLWRNNSTQCTQSIQRNVLFPYFMIEQVLHSKCCDTSWLHYIKKQKLMTLNLSKQNNHPLIRGEMKYHYRYISLSTTPCLWSEVNSTWPLALWTV